MKRLLSYLKPHKFVMTAATVLVLFIIVVELYRPIIIGDAIDNFINGYYRPYVLANEDDREVITWNGLDLTRKTDEELSLVCPTADVPDNTVRRSDGWRIFRIEGTLDFSLIGVLSRITSLLSDAGIAVFAVSTYNTDYLLTRSADYDRALDVLAANGYNVL